MSTWVAHHLPSSSPESTHERKACPPNMNGKTQGLPVSDPATVWQLEQGDSVQMSPHRWRLASNMQISLQGFHFSRQSSPHMCSPNSALQRSGRVTVGMQSSLQWPKFVSSPELSTSVAHNDATHETWTPLSTNGKTHGLPVSGPLTVWQLEQGDSVQMSPHRWRLSSWEQEPLQGFHFSMQSLPQM